MAKEKDVAFQMALAARRFSDAASNNYYGNRKVRKSILWPTARKVAKWAAIVSDVASKYYESKWGNKSDVAHTAARLGAKKRK